MQQLTADDPETKSLDPVAQSIERLKALFPEAFTEGQDRLCRAEATARRRRGRP